MLNPLYGNRVVESPEIDEARLIKILLAEGCYGSDSAWSYNDHEPRILQEYRELRKGLRLADHSILEQKHLILQGRMPSKGVGDRYGLVSTQSQIGDLVCILHGSNVPVILRECPNNTYQFICECYFEDCMHGEAVTWDEDGADEFILV